MTARFAGLFDRAADRIERNGLFKHAYYPGWSDSENSNSPWSPREIGNQVRSRNSKCCALGAIYAEAGDTEHISAADTFARHVGLESNYEIPLWNDKPSQRKKRVVAALRRAAQKEREHSE